MSEMTVLGLDLVPYRLPLARPWASARGNFRERRGWLVIARAGDLCGYGDCAPLPEAGTESHAAAGKSLADIRTALLGLSLERALEALDQDHGTSTPAAAYAVDCALSDLQCRLARLPLRQWLAAGAPSSVPVNGALGPLMEATRADLNRAARAGFRVVKLKVGIAAPEPELQRLSDLAEDLPQGMRLRLDANGAWDPGTATQVISALRGLPIESLEEPLTEPAWPALAALQAMADFPLALDESVPVLG